jgi:molybdopterin-containing oxidoreductase family membrane subunit
MKHLNASALLMLVTGSIVGYGYLMEVFMGWYSGNVYEKSVHLQWRPFGPYWWSFWGLLFCNIFCVQLLWFKPLRNNVAFLFIMSLIVNTGMWLERYVIVVTSLANPQIPSSGAMYAGTKWDWMTYIGTLGVFTFLFCLFLRALPVIAIAEVRELVLIKEGSADAASGPEPSDEDEGDLPATTPSGLVTAGGRE